MKPKQNIFKMIFTNILLVLCVYAILVVVFYEVADWIIDIESLDIVGELIFIGVSLGVVTIGVLLVTLIRNKNQNATNDDNVIDGEFEVVSEEIVEEKDIFDQKENVWDQFN